MLVIGWVENDPDMGKISQVSAGDASKAYPLINKICPPLARSMLNTNSGNAYNDWMESLYMPDNLKNYETLLIDFRNYLNQHNTKSIVVMTPAPASLCSSSKKRFDDIRPLIIKAGFPCFDLFDITDQKLGKYETPELQANHANGHPGILMTELLSDETLGYLQANAYLSRLNKKIK